MSQLDQDACQHDKHLSHPSPPLLTSQLYFHLPPHTYSANMAALSDLDPLGTEWQCATGGCSLASQHGRHTGPEPEAVDGTQRKSVERRHAPW